MTIKKLVILLFLMNSGVLFAQTKWSAVEKNLNQQMERNEISSSEWYSRLIKDAGYFGELNLWHKSEQAVVRKESYKKLRLYFPKEFQTIMPNGNKFAKVYLENNTIDTIEISRIDATLDNVREYFLIDNKWISFRANGKSSCGNSYYKAKLAPYHQLALELNNDVLIGGKNKILYKISITLDNQVIESNSIAVYLHDNQIKRIVEGLAKSK